MDFNGHEKSVVEQNMKKSFSRADRRLNRGQCPKYGAFKIWVHITGKVDEKASLRRNKMADIIFLWRSSEEGVEEDQ